MKCKECTRKIKNFDELSTDVDKCIELAICTLNKLNQDLTLGKKYIHVCDYYRELRDNFDLSEKQVFEIITVTLVIANILHTDFMNILSNTEIDVGEEYAS